MKRIEAVIRSDRLNNVVTALKEANVGGLTVIQSRGRGAGERPMITGGRGTTQYMADFNPRNTIITVVDDSKVDSTVSAITDAAHTGVKGDGKIFITNVEETIDIATKEKGSKSI